MPVSYTHLDDIDSAMELYDSHINLELAAGNYIAAVGSYDLSIEDAVDGVNKSSASPWTATLSEIPGEDWQLIPIDHGDYQIAFSGPIVILPEPASFGVACGGILVLLRRRRC